MCSSSFDIFLLHVFVLFCSAPRSHSKQAKAKASKPSIRTCFNFLGQNPLGYLQRSGWAAPGQSSESLESGLETFSESDLAFLLPELQRPGDCKCGLELSEARLAFPFRTFYQFFRYGWNCADMVRSLELTQLTTTEGHQNTTQNTTAELSGAFACVWST